MSTISIPSILRLIYCSKVPEVIVFDDLTQHNYGMVYEPLTFDTLEVILEKIAKFHALSMVLAESDEQKELVINHRNTTDREKFRAMFASITRNVKSLAEAIKLWPGFEAIGEKVDKSQGNLLDRYIDCYSRQSTRGFNVLNHGDFHIRNMMFRKNEKGTPNEVMFLDFQFPLYLSPGFDLVYMLNAIGAGDVRDRRDEVIKWYHSLLVQNLKLYGFAGEVPTVVDIRIELLHMCHMGG